jgi:hypothetical protein
MVYAREEQDAKGNIIDEKWKGDTESGINNPNTNKDKLYKLIFDICLDVNYSSFLWE